MDNLKSITIIGSGSYGTALAIALSRNGHRVMLWGYNYEHQMRLKKDRCNFNFLPHVIFPDTLFVETNFLSAVSFSQNILIVVPSYSFGNILKKIKPFLKKNTRIAWATKGLEKNTGRLLQDVAYEILGNNVPFAVISGPTFAKELASGLPTAITLSATEKIFAKDLNQLLHSDNNLRVYNNPDIIGVQLGGAIKNVIAIGAGISDGIGFGSSARIALITRGLTEMMRLGCALGAKKSTFMGMAGLGDLMLTCTDNQSRNRRFGILLGQGMTVTNAKNSIGQVVEGYWNTKEVKKLAVKYSVEMPISQQIYEIIYCNKKVQDAALTLLSREKKDEIT